MDSRNGSLRWLALVGGLLLTTGPLSAQQPTRKDTVPPAAQPAAMTQQPQSADTGQTHVVRRGDTLWDLAKQYLNDPFKWPSIFQANRGIIKNPHWIFPEQKLVIPGLPAMASSSTAVVTGVTVAPAAAAQPEAQPQPAAQQQAKLPTTLFQGQKLGRTRFYPGTRGVMPPAKPIHYPPVAAMEYRSAAWLAPRSTLKPVGTMLRVNDPGTATSPGGSPRYVHPRDQVFIKPSSGQAPQPGDQLLLVRPERKEGHWGTIWLPTAEIRVVGMKGGIIAANVEHQYEIVQSGDLALPLPQAPSFGADTAQAVQNGAEGKLLAFVSSKPLHAVEDEGFVDIGRDRGLRPGDELMAFLPGRVAGDPSEGLPTEAIARMRVVKVTDRTATVRVIALSEPVLRAGLAVRVYKKMP